MMDEDRGTIRSVAWSEIFPWLNLFRTFRLAIGTRVMLLGAVGAVLMLSGWWVLTLIFGGGLPSSVNAVAMFGHQERCPWFALADAVPDYPLGLAPTARALPPPGQPGAVLDVGPHTVYFVSSLDRITGPWRILGWPLLALFSAEVNVPSLAYVLLCGLWSLAVWAFFGGAITRIVSVQLACDERLPWPAVLRYATSKWLAYFSAPLFPLIGVLLAAVPAALCGLLLKTGPTMLIAAILWPLLLVCGLIMTLLLLGLIFGWPLMWSTISTEGTDSFDALSRSYAYVFQRPLHYLFYAVLAIVFGWLGWLLVSQFAAGVVGLTYWSASWGAGQARMGEILSGENLRLGGNFSRGLIVYVWVDLVKIVAVGFTFSYFWTAATAIYYLLRRQVDATEMDEVFVEEEQAFELPPMKTQGPEAPVVVEPPAVDAPPPPPQGEGETK